MDRPPTSVSDLNPQRILIVQPSWVAVVSQTAPNIAIEIKKLTKNETASGVLPGAEKKANASANENIAVKILNIPFCAYLVHILTTSFEVSVDALLLEFSSR